MELDVHEARGGESLAEQRNSRGPSTRFQDQSSSQAIFVSKEAKGRLAVGARPVQPGDGKPLLEGSVLAAEWDQEAGESRDQCCFVRGAALVEKPPPGLADDLAVRIRKEIRGPHATREHLAPNRKVSACNHSDATQPRDELINA